MKKIEVEIDFKMPKLDTSVLELKAPDFSKIDSFSKKVEELGGISDRFFTEFKDDVIYNVNTLVEKTNKVVSIMKTGVGSVQDTAKSAIMENFSVLLSTTDSYFDFVGNRTKASAVTFVSIMATAGIAIQFKWELIHMYWAINGWIGTVSGELYKMGSSIVSKFATSVSQIASFWRGSIAGIINNVFRLKDATYSLQGVLLGISSIGGIIWNSLKLGSLMVFSNALLRNAFGLFGITKKIRTPLTDVKKIITDVTDLLKVSSDWVGRSVKSSYAILGSFLLPINSIVSLFGTIGVLVKGLGEYLSIGLMKAGAFFGNTRAQLMLTIMMIKDASLKTTQYVGDTLKVIGKSIDKYTGGGTLRRIATGVGRITKRLTGIGPSMVGGVFRRLLPMIPKVVDRVVEQMPTLVANIRGISASIQNSARYLRGTSGDILTVTNAIRPVVQISNIITRNLYNIVPFIKDVPGYVHRSVSGVETIGKIIANMPAEVSSIFSKINSSSGALSGMSANVKSISDSAATLMIFASKNIFNVGNITDIAAKISDISVSIKQMIPMMQQVKPIMEEAPKLVQIMFGSIGGISRGLILMSKSITEIKNEMLGIETSTGKQRSYRDMLNIIVERATKLVSILKKVVPVLNEIPGAATQVFNILGGTTRGVKITVDLIKELKVQIAEIIELLKSGVPAVNQMRVVYDRVAGGGYIPRLVSDLSLLKGTTDQLNKSTKTLSSIMDKTKTRFLDLSSITSLDLFARMNDGLSPKEAKKAYEFLKVIRTQVTMLSDSFDEVAKSTGFFTKSRLKVLINTMKELTTTGKFTALDDLNQKINKLSSGKIGRARKNLGLEIINQISIGFQKGLPEVEELAEKLARSVAAFFPQSPAKKGPLKKLTIMGAKITQQLSSGMSSGVGYVTKAAGFIAESIARFFPRSPALVGALVLLSPMGRKIPFYIAQGMYSGISYVLGAAKKLTKLLYSEFKKSFEGLKSIFKSTFVMDESFTAVSKLSNVLKISGSSISDLSFMMRKLKKNGGDVKTALLDVAGALEANKDGYEGRVAILEKAGIMATSTLLPALSQGRQHLQRVFDLVEKSSAGISKLAGSYIRAKTAYSAYLDILKTSFFGEIYAGMSSYMDAASKSMEKVVTKYTIIIRTLGNIIGALTGKALTVLTSIVDLAVSKPSQAFVSLRVIFVKFTKLAGDDFRKFIKASITTASTFIMLSSIGLFKTIVTFGSTFTDELTNNSVSNFGNGIKVIKKSVMAVVNMIKKALKGILDYVTKIVKPVVDLVDMAKEVKAGAEVAKKNTTNFFTDMILGKAPKYIGPDQAKNEKSIDVKKNAITAPVKIVPPTVTEVKDATKIAIDAAVEEFRKGMSDSFKAFENAGPSQEYLDGLKKRSEDFFGTVKGEISKIGGEETLNKVNNLMESLTPDALLKKWNETRRAIQRATSLSSAATALEEKRRKDKEKETKMWQTSKSTMDEFGTAMSDMYEMTGKKHKEFFYMAKAIAIADATIKGANAIQTAMTYGWPGYAMIPFIASTTAINIAKIASSGFFAGGRVTEGSEYADSVPAMLAKDEFVINNRAAKKYGFGMLSDINSLRFADPRQVARNSAIKEAARAADGSSKGGTEVTIVNFVEKTAMKAYLASKEAGTIIVNHIGQNKNQVKKVLA